MKKLVLVIGILFSLLIIGNNSFGEKDLRLYFSFDRYNTKDKTVRDNSNYRNHGKCFWIQSGEGKSGNGVELMRDSSIEVPDSDSLDITDEITLMGWFQIKTYFRQHNMIAKWGFNPAVSKPAYHLWHYTFRGRGITFTLTINDEVFNFYSEVLLEKNRWTHIAVTYSNQLVTFYVDGLRKKQDGLWAQGEILGNEDPILLGNHQKVGRMDEILIWSKALSDTEINEWMGRGGYH